MMSAKRDCLFYEEYRDMGATTDLCTLKGTSWEDVEGCHCDDCRYYTSLGLLRCQYRDAFIVNGKGARDDTNKTV